MRKVHDIKFYKESSMELWSENRLIRWKARLEHHLNKIKEQNIPTWVITDFSDYVSKIDNILMDKKSNKKSVFNNINNDDLSGQCIKYINDGDITGYIYYSFILLYKSIHKIPEKFYSNTHKSLYYKKSWLLLFNREIHFCYKKKRMV